MIKQRFLGIMLIAISAAAVFLTATGETPQERDATAVLFTLPLGIYAVTTKQYILNTPREDATLKIGREIYYGEKTHC